MAETRRVLAFDFGASSGRAMIGEYDGEKITLKEVHRFSNDPVIVGDTMHWDTLRLFYEVKQGMIKAKHAGGFQSIAVDTWGVDFGLLDRRDDAKGGSVVLGVLVVLHGDGQFDAVGHAVAPDDVRGALIRL